MPGVLAWYGLWAAALFGITLRYHQAVTWFGASLSWPALLCALLALLAAQAWLRTGRPRHLLGSVAWSGLAPAWFGGGVLVGPLTSLYLLLPTACDTPSSFDL